MLSMLLNRIRKEDIPPELKLRIVFCGSAPVPAEVQIEFEKTFRIPVIEGYGMSETTCRSTFNPLPPPEALQLGKNDGYRKIGSVGLPLGNEMMVVDENGRPLKPHEIGEIVIRGENVMKGYYKNPQATAEAFRDGWFHSGDLGYYDEDGYFFIVDRKNDLIIRGGENIYPREIEEVLYKHPAVKDAACVGIPDELYGEEVAAFVVLKDHEKAGEEEIISCHRFLADFKCPKQVKSSGDSKSSGKLLRRKLRETTNKYHKLLPATGISARWPQKIRPKSRYFDISPILSCKKIVPWYTYKQVKKLPRQSMSRQNEYKKGCNDVAQRQSRNRLRLANRHSLAWHITKALSAAGARLVITYQHERFAPKLKKLLENLNSTP